MCEKCVRKSKRVKSKLSFGKVKVYAHRLLKGQAIPLFDRATNLAIEAHLHKIMVAREGVAESVR